MTTDRDAVNFMDLEKVYNCLKNSHAKLFPARCCLCGRATHRQRALCEGCYTELPWLGHACPGCAAPLPVAGQRCGHCQQRPPPMDSTRALFHYREPISQLILQLKFRQRLAIAPLFGELLADRLAAHPPLPEALLPVPLHAARQRQRGFNQSLEIARHAAQRFGIPLLDDYCRRTRNTAAQSQLPARERHRNVRGAFALRTTPASYRHIAIIDDVITTGSTSRELATLLRQADTRVIDCWAIARTDPTGQD